MNGTQITVLAAALAVLAQFAAVVIWGTRLTVMLAEIRVAVGKLTELIEALMRSDSEHDRRLAVLEDREARKAGAR